MLRFLSILSIFLYTTSLNSQSKIQKDRDAINKMCGCFEIQFNFKETFQRIDDEEYVPSKEYRSFALELAIPIINENKKISIQHLLIVGPPNNQSIIKHWRQDWVYQNQDLYTYDTANTWNYTQMAKKAVKGQWTQKVFQVDDSPRYEGSSSWVHVDGKSYWENTIYAPLPRREYSKRNDYNIMLRTNRHEITDSGWVHDQDNKKILKKEDEEIVLAEEKGLSPYKRVSSKKCAKALEWWANNEEKWSSIRNEWETVYEKKQSLTLNSYVSGKRLYEYLLFSNVYDEKEKHKELIESFILK
jgi:hypothetical protein